MPRWRTWSGVPGGYLAGDGVLDFASGTVVHVNSGIAGLVVITPACGFVTVSGALIMGLTDGVFCFWGVSGSKASLNRRRTDPRPAFCFPLSKTFSPDGMNIAIR